MTSFEGRIKVGVIGVGSMGRNHARVYSDLGVLEGISDVDFKTASELAERFDTKAYGDYKELLASTGEGTVDELAKGFGIDIRKPDFWRDSINLIGNYIDQYVQL